MRHSDQPPRDVSKYKYLLKWANVPPGELSADYDGKCCFTWFNERYTGEIIGDYIFIDLKTGQIIKEHNSFRVAIAEASRPHQHIIF
jgi:hypothetical protein